MGGKHKQQTNRTKNNARPSSSGRSAELLGNSLPQFVGFTGFKESGFSVPGALALTTFEMEIDSSIDSNFQLVLKKMNKKDSTTKLKALHEFAELTKGAEPDAVKAVLSFWPRLYGALATDSEHRVREAANLAHREIVVKVRKNIAPYLKQLAGSWFTSQYDTYAPAATAAQLSFTDAFPAAKQQDAIIFCQQEILAYITTNLTVHTAQTLSNTTGKSNTVTMEDAEAKYERVLVSSLLGYRQYLKQVPVETVTACCDTHRQIIGNPRFWKLGKHRSASVRGAWFGVLAAVCEKGAASQLLETSGDERKQLVTAVFGSLDESEPTVLPYVWEAMLLTVSTIEEWWNYISIEKLLLPKLWKVLRDAGQGNASVIYPSLLPLISNLPPVLDVEKFYPTFFDNMRAGFSQRSILSSRAESTALALAFVECIQYTIMRNQTTNSDLCHQLIVGQLLPAIQWCFTTDQTVYKTLFNQISALVRYWHKNRSHPSHTGYARHLESFWTIHEIFTQSLNNFGENYDGVAVAALAQKQVELLMSLKQAAVKPKKTLKVKFTITDSTTAPFDTTDSPSPSTTTLTLDDDTHYTTTLHSLVYNVCQAYVTFIERHTCAELLDSVSSLLQEFESEAFMRRLTAGVLKGDNDEGRIELYGLYERLLGKWLRSSYLCRKAVVDMVFLVFGYLGEGEREKVLGDFLLVTRQDCLGWCLTAAMSYPHKTDAVVQKWLHNRKVGDFLIKVVELEMSDECTPDLSLLLKKAFNEQPDGSLLLSPNTVTSIMTTLSNCLLSPSNYPLSLDTCASLAAHISAIVYSESAKLRYGDHLLRALFTLSCNNLLDNEILSTDTRWEVVTAWQDAITTLSGELDKGESLELAGKFVKELQRGCFVSGQKQELAPTVDDTSDKIITYIRAVAKSSQIHLAGEILSLFLKPPAVTTTTRQHLSDLCQISRYLTGRLCSPWTKVRDVAATTSTSVSDWTVLQCFQWMEVVTSVLVATACEVEEEAEGMEEEEEDEGEDKMEEEVMVKEEKERVDVMLKLCGDAEESFVELLYGYTLGRCYLEDYSTLQHCDKIQLSCDSIHSKLTTLYSTLNGTSRRTITSLLTARVSRTSWLWSTTLATLHRDVISSPQSSVSLFASYCKGRVASVAGESPSKTAGSRLDELHMLQTLSVGLSYDDVFQCGFSEVGRIVVLRCLLHCEEIEVQIGEVYTMIGRWRNEERTKKSFYNVDFSNWEQAEISIETIRLCTAFMESDKVNSINKTHWDFIIISLAAWCSRLGDVKGNYKNLQISAFMGAVAQLFVAVSKFVKRLQTDETINSYIGEWNDLFAENAQVEIVKTWLFLAEQFQSSCTPLPLPDLTLLLTFGPVTGHLIHTYMFTDRATSEMPRWPKILRRCCQLLLSSEHVLQHWGHRMLVALAPGLVTVDSVAVDTNTPHQKGLVLQQFRDLLVRTHEIVAVMLQDFKLGEDSCRVQPYTDSYTYTHAYLLTWDILLTLCRHASRELRYQYADWLRQENYLTQLLTNLFKLMPEEVLHHFPNELNPASNKQQLLSSPPPPMYEYFVTQPLLIEDVTTSVGRSSSESVERMVCWVYSCCVSQLPASVRQWWADASETRIVQLVERVTRAYVSPRLCAQELEDVASHETRFKNMVVKVHPGVREVVAVYTIDEAQMELVITLPCNYPLGGPDVQCNKQIGGTAHKQWLMQLRMCVLHQNGRIWDGLELWNSNLDRKFDGVEECCICYAMLHPGTYQLPKLSCSTCRKKFHSACLYKWFSTSNKSTCPICRNLF